MKKLFMLGLGIALSFAACSLEDPRQSSGKLQIQLEDVKEAGVSKGASTDSNGFLVASTVGDFNCFAVNVTGPGIAPGMMPEGCNSGDNFAGAGPGILSRTVARGTAIEVDVPTGKGRRIQVFGIYPPSQQCGGTATSNQYGYLLGTLNVDLAEPKSVTVPISFPASTPVSVVCSGGANQVTLSAMTSAASGTFTGYNKHSLSTFTAPSGAPAAMSFALPDSNLIVEDGATTDVSTNNGAAMNGGVDLQVAFDMTGIALADYSTMQVLWKGHAGANSTACGTGLTGNTGGVYDVYLYQNSSTSWISFSSGATFSNAATGPQIASQTFTGVASYPNANNRIIVQVRTQKIGTGASDCAYVNTDVVKLILTK